MSSGKRSADSIEQHQDGKRPMILPRPVMTPQLVVPGDMLRMIQHQNSGIIFPIDMAHPNLVQVKNQPETNTQKTMGETKQETPRHVSLQQFLGNEIKLLRGQLEEKEKDRKILGNEIKLLRAQFLEEKEKDRTCLKEEVKLLRDEFLKEKEKDRKCLENELKSLKDTFSAEKEKDRQCWIAQSNKMMYTEIQRIKYSRDSIDDSGDAQASDKKIDPKYGNCSHESQVSGGGEAELVQHYKNCTKNPGHRGLIPLHEFNPCHLPKGFQDQDIIDFIKATADLTVRIDLKVTSSKRPEFWPKTHVPFAFHNLRGRKIMRTGTGLVCQVKKWTESQNKGTCKCNKCANSNSPSKVWGVVRMLSALEVVFDAYEADRTTCRLFYNREESRFSALSGDWKVDAENNEQGWIVLKCVTCDQHVLDRLEKIWTQWRYKLWYKVNDKYKNSRERDRFTFIVSHPHGGPKKISLGKWLIKSEISKGWSNYTYSTATCPGSAGAYVHLLGYNDWNYLGGLVHSGVSSEGVNFSCAGLDME